MKKSFCLGLYVDKDSNRQPIYTTEKDKTHHKTLEMFLKETLKLPFIKTNKYTDKEINEMIFSAPYGGSKQKPFSKLSLTEKSQKAMKVKITIEW